MKSQKKHFLLAVLSAMAFIAACGKTGVDPPTEPTDQDAIYNIIRFDNPASFNLDLHDYSIPDTMLSLGPPYRLVRYWRAFQRDSLFIGIEIREPGPMDSVGTVAQGIVTAKNFIWGSLEIMAIDTSGGGSATVRLSKNFAMLGVINAFFEQLGQEYNSRRGWILKRISDAVFVPQVNVPAVAPPRIEIARASLPGEVIRVNTNIKPLSALPEFVHGESLTVFVYTDSTDFVSLRYSRGTDFGTREMTLNGVGVFVAGFSIPQNEGIQPFHGRHCGVAGGDRHRSLPA